MDTPRQTLMAVFAHPDDEAFGTGGTLAKYAAQGYDVHLVTATRGEAGQIADPSLANVANLPAVREQELRCACQAYGIHPPHFLDYVDGQLTVVHQGQAVGKLVHLIRQIRPQVVITFGPDGIYGHYDHIAVSRWTTIAVELATSPDCFPDQLRGACQPHQVDKVYFRVIPLESLPPDPETRQLSHVMMDGVPFAFHSTPMEEITTIIDVREYAEAKLRGILCHATQVGPGNPYHDRPKGALQAPFFQLEHFVLASSTVGIPAGVETDLFERLR